jgi:hypothetical protein
VNAPESACRARVRTLALAAMARAGLPPIAPPIGGLTALELRRLEGCHPRMLASLSRLLSHLPPTPEAAAARFAALRSAAAIAKAPATSRAPGPRRVPAVAH